MSRTGHECREERIDEDTGDEVEQEQVRVEESLCDMTTCDDMQYMITCHHNHMIRLCISHRNMVGTSCITMTYLLSNRQQ